MGLFRKNRQPKPPGGAVMVNGVRRPVRDDFAEYPFHILMFRDATRDGTRVGGTDRDPR